MNSSNPYNFPERPSIQHIVERTSSPIPRPSSNEMRVYHPGPKNGNIVPNGVITITNMLKKNSFNTNNLENIEHLKSPPMPSCRDGSRKTIQNNNKVNTPSTSQNINRSSSQTNFRDSIGNSNVSDHQKSFHPLKQSLCTSNFEVNEIHQKVKQLYDQIKSQDIRIKSLEGRIIENNLNLKKKEDLQSIQTLNIKSLQKRVNQKIDYFEMKLKNVNEEIKACLHQSQFLKIEDHIFDKVRQSLETFSTLSDSSSKKDSSDVQIKVKNFSSELDYVKKELEKKMQKNLDFLTNVISRIEKQMKVGFQNLSQTNPGYRSSFIKSENSPILLKYIEEFQVNKNGKQVTIQFTNNQYYIDEQGYLMDADKYYLMNKTGKKIKLDEQHFVLLRENRILE